MDKVIEKFIDYGIAGLVILALFAALYYIFNEHSKERAQWLDAYKENTEVLRLLTGKCVKTQ